MSIVVSQKRRNSICYQVRKIIYIYLLPSLEVRFKFFFFFFVTHSSLLSSTYTLLDQLISPKIFDAGEVTNKFELMFGTEDKR